MPGSQSYFDILVIFGCCVQRVISDGTQIKQFRFGLLAFRVLGCAQLGDECLDGRRDGCGLGVGLARIRTESTAVSIESSDREATSGSESANSCPVQQAMRHQSTNSSTESLKDKERKCWCLVGIFDFRIKTQQLVI